MNTNEHKVSTTDNKQLSLKDNRTRPIRYHHDIQGDLLLDIAKRSQKICTAIYLLTDLLDQDDPLIHVLKKTSVSITSSLHQLSGSLSDTSLAQLSSVSSLMYELHTHLDILYHSKRISAMNYDMLAQAIDTLQRQVHDLLNTYHDTELSVHEGAPRTTQVRIPHTFFDRWSDDISEDNDTKVAPRTSEPSRETQQAASNEDKKTRKKNLSQTVSNTPKASLQASPVSHLKSKKTVKASASDAKSIRHENVIKILKQKGVAKIGDLTAIITDCSSKTLQRDLNELVEEGVVLKKGERRWSTYELRSHI